MAFLRSCYSTQARFFYDSADTYPIIWYWADPDATRFTGRHTFAPLSLSGGSTADGGAVGEQMGASRPWRNGSIPMAYPSGVLDGSPEKFYLGQSTADPGIERTDFGIPTGCAGEVLSVCGMSGLNHFTWQVEKPIGTAHAVSVEVNPYVAFASWFAPEVVQVYIICGVPPELPTYDGVYLQVFDGSDDFFFYPSGFFGPGPIYGFSLVPGVPDPATDYFLRFEPGP